jgi:beta-glucanase (GH16 family)
MFRRREVIGNDKGQKSMKTRPRYWYRLVGPSLLTICVCASAHAEDKCPPPQSYDNMRLTFNSDFRSAKEVDSSQWRPVVGQHGGLDGELQVYTPDEIRVGEPRNLRIRTERKPMWGHPFRSGELTTQGLFSQTYGRFEMMAKMPEANGLWPAFWMLAERGHWPPEIDVVEYIHPASGAKSVTGQSKYGVPRATVHWADEQGRQHAVGKGDQEIYLDLLHNSKARDGLGPDFHLYAVDWRPHQINFSIDGKSTFCVHADDSADPRIPNSPMYMILNDAVAAGTEAKPGWAGYLQANQAFPVDFEIAYVKAYQFKDIIDPPLLDFDLDHVKISNTKPVAGESLAIEADAAAGSNDLPPGEVRFELKRFYNAAYADGLESTGSAVQVHVPGLSKKQTFHLHATLAIPDNSQGGYYALIATSSYPLDSAGAQDNAKPQTWRAAQALSFYVEPTLHPR